MQAKPLTILLFDDYADTLELVERALRHQYKVEKRLSAHNALDDVLAIEPDLILMDYLIDRGDSWTAIEQLKQDERTKHIPLVLFTGHSRITDIASTLQLEGYIPKPFSLRELRESIEQIVSRYVPNRILSMATMALL